MGGCRLLYFLKSKKWHYVNARIILFYVFLCQYIHSFVFLEMAERGELQSP